MKVISKRLIQDVKDLALEHKDKWPYLGAATVCLMIYGLSYTRDEVVHIYRSEKAPDFKDARILGSQGDSIYEGKERLLAKTMRDLKDAQEALKAQNAKLQAKVDEMERGQGITHPNPSSNANSTQSSTYGPEPLPSGTPQTSASRIEIRTGLPPEGFTVTHGSSQYSDQSQDQGVSQRSSQSLGGSSGGIHKRYSGGHRILRERGGTTILSFPVKDTLVEKTEEITLPSGSYVKAKLMTGVEAPEGKTYPVLLQLDYAYIVPNHHKLDLTGCFMIAKSQGDLSTERVQMQATKLSCVSKAGKMFEREVNGFIADDKDNSFAVMGSVNSKQDRVAAMAFLASIAEGVGKSIQQSQTTQQVTPLGGSQSVMTGNQSQYLVAGGAADAAGMVTSWYLKQAQNLLPTINVGSGQDIWIVMQDTVKLPHDFFRLNMKGESSHDDAYTYLSRVLD